MGFAEVVSPMVEWRSGISTPSSNRRTIPPARCRTRSTCVIRRTRRCRAKIVDSPVVSAGRPPSQNDSAILENVRLTHEDGWETGSEGWGYKWSPERSQASCAAHPHHRRDDSRLAANPNPPGKFFCVGWTYRNETISFKHLPVFHQVDGIIIDEEANLASLMGTLQEFYSKMGFGRVKFKPAFYPYTEPSVDVGGYNGESRVQSGSRWAARHLRPEVTLPLGCKFPVLAWGLASNDSP